MARMILAFFDLQVTPMLPTKFRVNWPFSSEEEVKNRFSRWPPWQPSLISNQNKFSYFWSTSHPDTSYQVLSQLAFFGSGEDAKNRFSSGHLGFSIGTILAIYDVQVTPMLPTKFKVTKPFGSGEVAKNRFSKWPPWWPSWISDRNHFSYFWSISHPDYQVSS